MSRDAALAARVKAVNAAHQYANEIFPVLQATFIPFVGCRVTKTGGTFLEKVKKALPQMPNGHPLQVYHRSFDWTLAFTIRTCEMIGDTTTCLYYEITVYVGDMQDGVLTKLTDNWENARTDFTEAEIVKKRHDLEVAQKAADAIRSSLYPFADRYDN